MRSSVKPWLAGRQPSDRGGVLQVKTWLIAAMLIGKRWSCAAGPLIEGPER